MSRVHRCQPATHSENVVAMVTVCFSAVQFSAYTVTSELPAGGRGYCRWAGVRCQGQDHIAYTAWACHVYVLSLQCRDPASIVCSGLLRNHPNKHSMLQQRAALQMLHAANSALVTSQQVALMCVAGPLPG
jgi:hypothetical protein